MTSEKQYISLFDDNKEIISRNSINLLNRDRDMARSCFGEKGFPSRKVEHYRYTDVQAAFAPDYGVNVNRLQFPLDSSRLFRCNVPHIGSAQAYMVGDRFVGDLSAVLPAGVYVGSLSACPEKYMHELMSRYNSLAPWKTDGIVALNTMLAQDGLLIYIEKGIKVDPIIQIVNLGRSRNDLMTNRRVMMVLEEEAELSLLLCDHNMDSCRFLTTQVAEVWLESNSRLDFCALEETGENNSLFESWNVHQKSGSRLDAGFFTLRNGLTRRTIHVDLAGEEAYAQLFGGVIGDDRSHTDNYLLVEHSQSQCSSNVLFKYVLDGESRGAFAGKVLVREGAQQTDSLETNNNLCVSPKARMYTQPMLEIYADDVKCNHGATVGKLDEQALYYMAQRGIPEEEANLLLQEAFLGDAIRRIGIEAIRERMAYLVEQRFRHKLKGCGNCSMCVTKKN